MQVDTPINAENTERLFVYGTLMRTYGNNILLKEHDAQFLYESSTARFVMWSRGLFPAIVRIDLRESAPDCYVTGELWAVSPACLEETDRLEGTATGFYRRETVTLLNGQIAWAYVAEIPERQTTYQRVYDGKWRNQADKSPQGTPNTHAQSIYMWPHSVYRDTARYDSATNTWNYGTPKQHPLVPYVNPHHPYIPPKPKVNAAEDFFGPIGRA